MRAEFKVLACLLLALFAPWAAISATRMTENPSAHLGYIYPAGGQQGSTFEVRAGGESIYGCVSAAVSGKGVTVEVLDAKEPREGKKKRKDTSVIDEVVKLRVKIAPDAEPGVRELRINSPIGLSNSLAFQVGELKEVVELAPGAKKGGVQELPPLPVLVNGQIMPGEVDRYSFAAKAGQKLVIESSVRALIPYIADAVPGWFQADLTLLDANGNELAHAFDFMFRQDPVILYECKADGIYTVAIKDAIFRGREDFVYRLKIGELPFIKCSYPLGARSGALPVKVTLDAWNTPSPLFFVDVKEPGEKRLSIKRSGLLSNSIPFAVGTLPETEETQASSPGVPQKLSLPIVVNGKIRSPGEIRKFCFEGKKGQKLAIELTARRLGSPLDSFLALFGPNGELIKECDDWKDPSEAMLTHNADSYISLSLPEDGLYTLRLSDTQGAGGEDYAYRLRVSQPQPDFELRVMPSSVNIPSGGSASLNILAIRKDGFKGPIKLTLKNAGNALALDGALIPEGADKIQITLTAKASEKPLMLTPAFEGSASVEGKEVKREAVPAEDFMQAFIYRHAVEMQEEVALVTGPAPFALKIEMPADGKPLELPKGKDVNFFIKVVRAPGINAHIKLHLLDPPNGIVLARGFIPPEKDRVPVTVRADAKAPSNLKSNLIIVGVAQIERDEATGELLPTQPPAPPAQAAAPAAPTAALPPAQAAPGVQAQPTAQATPSVPAAAEASKAPERKIKKDRIAITAPALPFTVIENKQ